MADTYYSQRLAASRDQASLLVNHLKTVMPDRLRQNFIRELDAYIDIKIELALMNRDRGY